jgi:RNA polymerase sigma factor (sigma-70 family)
MTVIRELQSPALERVVSTYAAMLRAAARRKGLSDVELDEVIQEVRIRLWGALDTPERIAAVNTSYVYQTAMSAVCDLIRRRRGDRTVSLEEDPTLAGIAVPTPLSPDRALERLELAGSIERALEDLSAAQRPVVRMYLAGYPQREIETLLGWTEAKTRNVLYRGLAEIRKALASQGLKPGVAR